MAIRHHAVAAHLRPGNRGVVAAVNTDTVARVYGGFVMLRAVARLAAVFPFQPLRVL